MQNIRAGSQGSSGNIYERAGFIRANSPMAHRIVMAIDGLEKSGKTHFALSAPAPIAVINTDIGLDGVIQKWQSDKEIWVQDVRFSVADFREMKPEEAAKAADEIMKKVHAAMKAVLGQARTVIYDNATEIWELVRLSHFGKLDQVKPHHYVHPNNEYREIIRSAFDQSTTNLILLHKMANEYVNDKTTGKKQRKGFSDTGYLVQMNAVCWRDPTPNIGVPDCFHMTVMDSRQNPELAGLDVSGAELNFPAVAQMTFPDSNIEEWL